MSALRDQIKREISEYKRVCKEQGRLDWGRWFNNFYCNLPEGLPEGTLSVGRTGCRAVTPQNISLRELGVSNLSELRLNQSFAGFYNAIDDALKAERISVAKVVRGARTGSEGRDMKNHDLWMALGCGCRA